MKLGKAHMIGSLIMTALATVYTIWSLSSPTVRPAAAVAVEAPPINAAPAAAAAAVVDPTRIPPVPDVVLDRLPAWPRDPFTPRWRAAPAVVEGAAPEAEPAAPPDLEVAAILYSATRRIALVNGRRVRVGDRIEDAVVVDILPDAVVFDSPVHGRRTVERRSVGASLGTAGENGGR